MFTRLQIINIGLSKIASSRITQIDPPTSSLERYMADNYVHWKRSELTKRRWVFATEDNYALTQVEVLTGADKPYKYSMPVDMLRPIRQKRTEWKQRRQHIYSAENNLKISYVADVQEDEFDPLFVEVLACRIAMDSAEYITQSNTKKADAKAIYDAAVLDAGKVNAFIIGPEDNTYDEEDYPFITSRF